MSAIRCSGTLHSIFQLTSNSSPILFSQSDSDFSLFGCVIASSTHTYMMSGVRFVRYFIYIENSIVSIYGLLFFGQFCSVFLPNV